MAKMAARAWWSERANERTPRSDSGVSSVSCGSSRGVVRLSFVREHLLSARFKEIQKRNVEKQRRVTTLWIWISHGNHAAIILPRPVFGSAPSSWDYVTRTSVFGAVPTESFYRKSGPRRSLVAKDKSRRTVSASLRGKSSRHNGKIHPRRMNRLRLKSVTRKNWNSFLHDERQEGNESAKPLGREEEERI